MAAHAVVVHEDEPEQGEVGEEEQIAEDEPRYCYCNEMRLCPSRADLHDMSRVMLTTGR